MGISQESCKRGRLEAALAIANKELAFQNEEKEKRAAELVIMEQQQRVLEKEMARLEQLNLVGQIAAGIGHEIRNPMTTVRGYLQLLGARPANEHQKTTFDLMISELDRANAIITEFLSLAKVQETDLRFENLNEIIKNLFPLLQADAFTQNKDARIILSDIPNFLPLNAKEIIQLILNLCRNGLDAMNDGDCLTIKTHSTTDEVILTIEDEGCGIPTEHLAKLGTPFFTTKNQGTGLGLAICYRIAQSNCAKIDVSSSPKGTVFRIRFTIPCGSTQERDKVS
ncbi:MAG TPA: ATP-binding protein [Desulfosporosinus sp.]